MRFRSVAEQLMQEIGDLYGSRRAPSDYKGKIIDEKHVTGYFYKTYHRANEIIRCVRLLSGGRKGLDIGIAYGFYDMILKEVYGYNVVVMEMEVEAKIR